LFFKSPFLVTHYALSFLSFHLTQLIYSFIHRTTPHHLTSHLFVSSVEWAGYEKIVRVGKKKAYLVRAMNAGPDPESNGCPA
ncbi:hypothetical protein C8J57DRAFT_1368249, partial [Mycena rebaudengoi]